MVFATLPAEDLRGAEVLQWQVERVFKRFRSIAQLEHLPSHDDRNAKTWLHGKLLLEPGLPLGQAIARRNATSGDLAHLPRIRLARSEEHFDEPPTS